jgi:protein-S-isoprenylcysteine O-methyltransferase Ste14
MTRHLARLADIAYRRRRRGRMVLAWRLPRLRRLAGSLPEVVRDRPRRGDLPRRNGRAEGPSGGGPPGSRIRIVSAWRQGRAIAPLPGVVTVLVPFVIIAASGSNVGWGLDGGLTVLPVVLGVGLISAGFCLWLWTVRLFARLGEGTLAPWDPTRHLVVEGPYRYVRNPMITAVLAVLAGEAALFGSLPLLIWCSVFFAVNFIGFQVYEEPGLERRFGEEYRAYRRNVPRWLPRRSPSAAERVPQHQQRDHG